MTDILSADHLRRLRGLRHRAGAGGRRVHPAAVPQPGLKADDKGGPDRGYDPVTAADKGAEAAMRAAIAARFPDHGVIGEEQGEDRPDAEFVWVLDPVDGTRAFVAGLPLWTTLIALRWRGAPVVGCIGQSYLDEVYVGTRLGSRLLQGGAGVTLHGAPLPAPDRRGDRHHRSRSSSTEPRPGPGTRSAPAARLARYGCDGYAFARLAAGTLDLVAEAGLRSWDIEAAMPLIEGAGGVVVDWRGGPIGPDLYARGGQVVAAGDPACLDEALVALRRAAA